MFLRSPLPYTGSKYKLLSQLLPLFPNNIETFYDLFCGGFNVGLNVPAQNTIAVDSNCRLIEIFNEFKNEQILEYLNEIINQYSLSKTNLAGYLALRDDYNLFPSPVKLFLLICHSFNFQMRFNKQGDFNMPFGKNRSCFNQQIRNNLCIFLEILHQRQFQFESGDYQEYLPDSSLDFVYADPPYSLGTAVYNTDWSVTDDGRLFGYLDKLDSLGYRFGMSNVVIHKGVKHELLAEWSQKYVVHEISCHYRKNSYHKQNRSLQTQEIYVTNYKSEKTS